MLNQVLDNLANAWSQLSKREQRLAIIVGLLLAAFVVVMGVQRTTGHISTLDKRIDALQDSILNYTRQISLRKSVESQYAKVASSHSSKWTEAEIQDRLRQEIYRLAEQIPPPLDENGIPVRTTSEAGALVEIPALSEGTLMDGGENYREFQLSFRVPTAEFRDLVDFLARLQESPQSLRIDGLEINRDPLSTKVRAAIDITRIVADTADDLGEEDGAEEEQDEATARIRRMATSEWDADGAELSLSSEHTTANDRSLLAEAMRPGALFYRIRALPAGEAYDFFADITAQGKAYFGISDLDGQAFSEPVPIEGDGTTYRVHVRFMPPSGGGGRVRMRLPFIEMEEEGGRVYVDRILVRRAVQ